MNVLILCKSINIDGNYNMNSHAKSRVTVLRSCLQTRFEPFQHLEIPILLHAGLFNQNKHNCA
jgi:hypothetical protein